MSIKILGVEDLMASIQQGGERATKGVLDEMRKIGVEIRDTARDYAPIDKGDLEKSIKVREEGGERGMSGRFSRKSVEVYIDTSMPSSDGSGHFVEDYAYEMHEHLTPYGPLKLGPRSQLKQSTTSGMVGGGFLERAVDEMSDGLMARLVRRSRSSF